MPQDVRKTLSINVIGKRSINPKLSFFSSSYAMSWQEKPCLNISGLHSGETKITK
jgi:hypothetical protein